MDYEVFLLSRMRESWEATGDNPTAVAHGLERSGRIVTSAALIVIVVAGSFAFADIVLIKALGRRHRDRGRARCDGRPRAARARDDAPPRALELVAARAGSGGRCRRSRTRRPGVSRARARGRRRSALRRRRVRRRPDPRQPAARLPDAGRADDAADAPTDPIPVELPRDDGPHDRLTEWWYYTGHLRAEDGRRFGFEAVVFRAERGSVPPSWAAHLALTDEAGGRFTVRAAERDRARRSINRRATPPATPTGFDLQVAGPEPGRWSPAGAPAFGGPWRLAGSGRRGPDRGGAHRRGGGRGGPLVRARASRSRRPSLRRSTTATGSSTSGRRARRTTTRGRGSRRPAS